MNSARILIVDDDDHVREALVDELSDMYQVEAVASGREAFDALALKRYDVVISDLKMPDHDGIEVLDFAREHQEDAVRVLLTGYLDERAQRALLRPDAPFKVGKPWHDEIEIVIKRGLEQRELARGLVASVEDALALVTLDEELAATTTPLELAEVIVRRALTVEGVVACGTIVRTEGAEHLFTGGAVGCLGPGWYVDLPLDADGDLRLRARGRTDAARQLVSYMAHRAQRAAGVLEARVSTKRSPFAPTRLHQLMRQATIGALTSSLLHDLASTMQTLSSAIDDVREVAQKYSELADPIGDISAASDEAIQLFVHMRKFIKDGEVAYKPVRIDRLVQRVARLAGGYVRERAQLRIGELPQGEIDINESLFLQVLVNLLRNAANASPAEPRGAVDLKVRLTEDEAIFTVVDDGPGVSPDIADFMFEPFSTTSAHGTGLGLAISAYVMQMLEGRLTYRKDAERGACFTVTLPRHRG
jgi:C4-dicarboxylate-specific signal transduction histidine kinase/FixJ family two-component response regulator